MSNMVKRVNLLMVQMKKQGSECIRIIPSLKNILGKHFNVFHNFAEAAKNLLSFSLCRCFCVYVCGFIC